MPSPSTALHLLRSMRPHQWTKNLLLFAGILFSHNFTDAPLLGRAVLGFALFCLASGAIYIVNDLADIEADRLHPRKRQRPLASGKVMPGVALVFAIMAAVVAIGASFWLSLEFGVTTTAYVVITVLYSHVFKHVAIVDIILLALGFVLRAVAGVVVIRVDGGPEVPMTPWFVICVFFLALLIAICKRRHELIAMTDASEHRRVLAEYSPAYMDQMISVSASATLISYALYLIASVEATQGNSADLQMISTLPFVIYGVFRYLYLVYKKSEGGEPERLLLKDKPLLLNTLLWLVLIISIHHN